MGIVLKILIILAIIVIVFFGIAFINIQRRRPKFTNKGFTPLEKKLLEEFTSLFDDNLKAKLLRQISYFENKRKWRQYWEKSMSIELYGNNSDPLPEADKYPRRDESKISTIGFTVNGQKFTVEFDTYDGAICGWKIRPNPKGIQNQTSPVITRKKINNDPNEVVRPFIEKEEFKAIPEFTGVLKDLQKISPIKKANKPLLKQQQDILIGKIEAKLPPDYLSIIEQAEGLEFDNCRISGISEIQRTGLDNGNYYQLAEFDDGVVAIKEDEKNGTLYFCHFSEGLIDSLGQDFIKAIAGRLN